MPDQSASTGKRPFERVNYFHGAVLGVDDFQTDQRYFIDKSRAHNRLHGWGVVSGLHIEPTAPQSEAVTVTPGAALDPQGREIVVNQPVTVDLGAEIASAQLPCILFVVIEYGEQESATAPVVTPDGPATQPTRIRESPRVHVTHHPPSMSIVGSTPDQPVLVLAAITVKAPGPITADHIDNARRHSLPAWGGPHPGHNGAIETGPDEALRSLQLRVEALTTAVVVLAAGLGATLLKRFRQR